MGRQPRVQTYHLLLGSARHHESTGLQHAVWGGPHVRQQVSSVSCFELRRCSMESGQGSLRRDLTWNTNLFGEVVFGRHPKRGQCTALDGGWRVQRLVPEPEPGAFGYLG